MTPVDQQQAVQSDDFPYYEALYGERAHLVRVWASQRALLVYKEGSANIYRKAQRLDEGN